MNLGRRLWALVLVLLLAAMLGAVPVAAAAAAEPQESGESVQLEGKPHTKENGEKYQFAYVDYDEYMPASRQFYYILKGLEENGWITRGLLPFTLNDLESQQLTTDKMYAALETHDLGPYIAFAKGAFHYLCYEKEEAVGKDLTSRAGKDIDLIITFGTSAGVFVKSLGLSVPMVDFSATDPVASGIIDSSTEGSGNPNVWAQVEFALAQRQLKYYYSMKPFQRLGCVIYGDEITSAVPDIVASSQNLGYELVKYNIDEQPRETQEELERYYKLVQKNIEAISRENIDAFFLTVDLINDYDRLPALLKPLYEKEIPVYLMDDSSAVRAGGLMLISAYDLVNVGRFVADAIGQILNGAEAGGLPCVTTSAPAIYVNFDVAKSINYPLSFEFLSICDEIYTKGGQ